MGLPISSSKVALQALATLDVPAAKHTGIIRAAVNGRSPPLDVLAPMRRRGRHAAFLQQQLHHSLDCEQRGGSTGYRKSKGLLELGKSYVLSLAKIYSVYLEVCVWSAPTMTMRETLCPAPGLGHVRLWHIACTLDCPHFYCFVFSGVRVRRGAGVPFLRQGLAI